MSATTLNTIGRRKTAVARIWMSKGTGEITINNRSFEEYLPSIELQNSVLAPLQAVSLMNKYDINVSVRGSGLHAQATAIRHAISRAICDIDTAHRATLKPLGFLTRDPRMKERKKYGQPGARKRFQFSKR